jgi:hypothetical protein
LVIIDESLEDVEKATRVEGIFRRALEKQPGHELLELGLASHLVWLSGHSSDRAGERAQEVRDICLHHIQAHRHSENAQWPYLYLARLAAESGEWDEAWRLVEQARRWLTVEEGTRAFWFLIKVLLRIPDGEQETRSLAFDYLERYPHWWELRGFLVASLMADGDRRAEEQREMMRNDWPESEDELNEYLEGGVADIKEARESLTK